MATTRSSKERRKAHWDEQDRRVAESDALTRLFPYGEMGKGRGGGVWGGGGGGGVFGGGVGGGGWGGVLGGGGGGWGVGLWGGVVVVGFGVGVGVVFCRQTRKRPKGLRGTGISTDHRRNPANTAEARNKEDHSKRKSLGGEDHLKGDRGSLSKWTPVRLGMKRREARPDHLEGRRRESGEKEIPWKKEPGEPTEEN